MNTPPPSCGSLKALTACSTRTTESAALASRRKLSSMVSIAIIAAACVNDAVAFTGNWNYSWGDTKYSFASIGTAIDRTCFMTGMTGDIQPFNDPTNVSIGDMTSVGVKVNSTILGSYYTIYVDSDGGALGVYARCVNTAAGRTGEVYWHTGQSAQVLGAVTAKRRCFLTQIGTSNITDYGGFRYGWEYVRVWKDSSNWYLGGFQSGSAWGAARCIDVSEDHGNWQWVAGDPGTRKDPLAYNPGGVTCFLTGVGGRFDKSDWADGVFITYGGINQFSMNTANGKTGWANCVK